MFWAKFDNFKPMKIPIKTKYIFIYVSQ